MRDTKWRSARVVYSRIRHGEITRGRVARKSIAPTSSFAARSLFAIRQRCLVGSFEFPIPATHNAFNKLVRTSGRVTFVLQDAHVHAISGCGAMNAESAGRGGWEGRGR